MKPKVIEAERISSSLLFYLIVITNIIWLFAVRECDSYTARKLREEGCVNRSFNQLAAYIGEYGCPNNVKSPDGKPFLSWRVLVSKGVMKNDEELQKLDLTKPWYDPEVARVITNSLLCCDPALHYPSPALPYSSTTRFVRIKEIDAAMREGSISHSALRNKAYIVVLKPQYAFPAAKPYDVSWRELASGKVEIEGPPYRFCTVYGESLYRDNLPETEDGWQEFCGADVTPSK